MQGSFTNPSRPRLGQHSTFSRKQRQRVVVMPQFDDHVSDKFLSAAALQTLWSSSLTFSSVQSEINRCSLAYQEMLQYTREQTFPNSLRTSFSCALLERIIHSLFPKSREKDSAVRELLDLLLADIFASLYFESTPETFLSSAATASPDASLSRFKNYTFYFKEHEVALTERDSFLNELTAKRNCTTKELMLMERIIHRWQTMLLDRLFCAWKQYVRNRHGWRCRMEALGASRCRRQTLRAVFDSWRHTTKECVSAALVDDLTVKHNEQVNNEETLLQEYAKLVSGIETLKQERAIQQESVRKLTDEVASLAANVESLQSRLERQRATSAAWKDLALQLQNAVIGNTPKERLSQKLGRKVSDSSAFYPDQDDCSDFSWAGEPTQVSNAQRTSDESADPVLVWVNKVLKPMNGARGHQVLDYGAFCDGFALLGVALALGAMTQIEHDEHSNRARVNPAATVRTALTSLSQWMGATDFPSLPDEVDVVCNTNSVVLRLFLARLKMAANQCPTCSWVRSTPQAVSREDQLLSVVDVVQRVRDATEYHRQSALEGQLQIHRAWEGCCKHLREPRNAALFEASFRRGVAEFQWKGGHMQDIVDILACEVNRQRTPLNEVYLALAQGSHSSTVEGCERVFNCTGLQEYTKRIPAKTLRHVLCVPGDQCETEKSTSSVVCRDTLDGLVATIVFAKASAKSAATVESMQAEFGAIVRDFIACLQTVVMSEENSVAQDFNQLFFRDDVTSELRKISDFTLTLWGPHEAERSVDQFLSLLSERAKIIDKNCSVMAARQIFDLVTFPHSVMTFSAFQKSVVALSLLKDSSPCVSIASKIRKFASSVQTKRSKK